MTKSWGREELSLIVWEIFTERWLERAERGREYIDDGDRFISLWIAFNGWMKWKFGEAELDKTLIKRLKKEENVIRIFEDMRNNNPDFAQLLQQLGTYTVADMRYLDNSDKMKRYDGTFESLIKVIYQVRCNLFHGRKDIDKNKKDIELVSLAYRILLPLFKSYLSI